MVDAAVEVRKLRRLQPGLDRSFSFRADAIGPPRARFVTRVQHAPRRARDDDAKALAGNVAGPMGFLLNGDYLASERYRSGVVQTCRSSRLRTSGPRPGTAIEFA